MLQQAQGVLQEASVAQQGHTINVALIIGKFKKIGSHAQARLHLFDYP